VSSVFLARRLEERNNPEAEAFALKIPEYDPATARSMTEQEFFQMFRDEAGALLSLPSHENLARFVTFDLSARPKPILVMELIRGTPLDRLIRSKALMMPRVISHLDGILAGLEAMHSVQVGHLDIKASNVILRHGSAPVLVDFGLSGRALRPGCGTIEYTSPEVLGVAPPGAQASPMAADIYSFGCLMFEMITGEVLFDGPDEMALVSRHVSHDGWFGPLIAMSEVPGLDRLANLTGMCLRHDGRNRPSASKLRNELTPALLPLADMEWPLKLPASGTEP
jgi:serine/threonine protein kinase